MSLLPKNTLLEPLLYNTDLKTDFEASGKKIRNAPEPKTEVANSTTNSEEILQELLRRGHKMKHFRGVRKEKLFLPEKGCHLEIERNPDDTVTAIVSVKNRILQHNDGRSTISPNRHGYRIEFNEKNGRVKSMATWKNNTQEGFAKIYTEHEDLHYSGNWSNGKPDGLITYVHEDGSKKRLIWFKKGKRQGIDKSWSKAGLLTQVQYWIDDKAVTRKAYFSSQIITPQTKFEDAPTATTPSKTKKAMETTYKDTARTPLLPK